MSFAPPPRSSRPGGAREEPARPKASLASTPFGAQDLDAVQSLPGLGSGSTGPADPGESAVPGHPVGRGSPQGTSRPALLVGLVLVALILVVFLPALDYGFISLDDPEYVSENPQVARGLTWDTWRWAWQANVAANWHPVTLLSHLLDGTLYGTNPRGHHLTSLLLHLANTALLFALLRRMTGILWPSALVAAWFGLHPLRVESVVWVAERKDVLSGLFFLLTLWVWHRWVTSGGRHRYLAALGLFVGGLLAKPMLVTLPCVLLLLDVWPLGRLPISTLGSVGATRRRLGPLLWEKLPFFLVVAVASAITLAAQRGAISSLDTVPFGLRVTNALTAYLSYLGKTLWPTGLAIFYPLPTSVATSSAVAASLLLLLVTAFALWRLALLPWLATGWLWFLGMLVPVIGLVQVGRQAFADRYTYLPAIGLFVAIAWTGRAAARRWPPLRRPLTAAAISSVLALAVVARAQVAVWRDDQTLFTHALAVTEDNVMAHLHLGILLAPRDEATARGHFQAVIRIAPNLPEGQAAFATALRQWGRPAEALVHAETAAALAPAWGRLHLVMATLLDDLGRRDEAIAALERAVANSPRGSREAIDAHHGLGSLLVAVGRRDAALAHYRAALAAEPGRLSLWTPTAILLAEHGELPAAIDLLAAAVDVAPSAEGHRTLARLLEQAGRSAEASDHLDAAAGLAPTPHGDGDATEHAGGAPDP